VPRTRIERLASAQTSVTADTALRLAKYFGTTAAFWMGMRAQYDLEHAEGELGARLRTDQRVYQRIINLYDCFTHSDISRREFLDRLAELAGSSGAPE
jgi:plasmid maintenance system antidote protein VapI